MLTELSRPDLLPRREREVEEDGGGGEGGGRSGEMKRDGRDRERSREG